MAYFLGFLYIAAYIVIYLSLLLLPYYVAYSIIEPHSFLGVVGVFVLGSVIVPLTLGLAFLIFGSFFVAFDKFKEKIGQKSQSYNSSYNNENSPLDVTPKIEKKSIKDNVLFTILGLGTLGFIIFLIVNAPENTESAYYEPAHDSSYSEDDEVASESVSWDNTYNYPEGSEVPVSYSTNSIVDNHSYMSYSIDELLKTLSDKGISGVARSVRDCYIDVEVDKLYCVYLDHSARLIDEIISKQMGIDRDEYLKDDKVQARTQKYYYIPTNTSHLAFNHQNIIEPQLISLISRKAQEKRYKSQNESAASTSNTALNSYDNSTNSRLDTEMSQNFNSNTDNIPEPEPEPESESELVGDNDHIRIGENNELEVDYE